MQQNDRPMTLDEINSAFIAQLSEEAACDGDDFDSDGRNGVSGCGASVRYPGSEKPRTSGLHFLSDILFYLIVAAILCSALSTGSDGNKPVSVMGYSCFSVMSSSMKDEIPRGSLILVRRVDPARLAVGDNITFARESATVTHKIIGIMDYGAGPGALRFQTKGVNNASPDNYTVAGSDVLGKVVVTIPGAGDGDGVSFILENMHILLFAFISCSAVSFILRGISAKAKKKKCNWR